MYGRIIVGFDGSEGGDDAVALGRLLADRRPAASWRRLSAAPSATSRAT